MWLSHQTVHFSCATSTCKSICMKIVTLKTDLELLCNNNLVLVCLFCCFQRLGRLPEYMSVCGKT